MKYVIVGDPHFGKKHFSIDLFYKQLEFWKEIVKENLPIICVGDLFDNRISMNIHFFNIFEKEFIGLLRENNSKLITILGNHDIYFKSTREINLVKYLPELYDGIKVIQNVEHIDNITFVPWIINKEDIPKTYNEIVIGHFEFSNVDPMIQGNLSPKTFEKAKLIISGHYHNKIQYKNIIYIGTPYWLDWNDFNQEKGYYILDTETKELEFKPNTINKKFVKIIVDKDIKILGAKDLKEAKNNYTKIILKIDNYKKLQELKKELPNAKVINEVELESINEIEENIKSIYELIPKKYLSLVKKIKEFNEV